MIRIFFTMFVAMSLIPAGDAAGKLLTAQGISPAFVAWSRFALGLVMIASIAGITGLRLLRDWRFWMRGGFLTGGISSIQIALKTSPLADVFAAFFIGPLVSYILAGFFLKEPMSRIRAIMLVFGFFGVLLVLRPGTGIGAGIGFALLAGFFYGAFLTSSRWLATVAAPTALTVSQLAVGTLLLAPIGLYSLPELSAEVVWLTAVSAGCSMLGNLILLYAYRVAPATTLAPLVYLQLLAATALGWLVFQDIPTPLTWLGMIVIISAGIAAARAR